MTESFADLKMRSRMANQEKANRRFATGGAVPDRTKSKTVTTGKAAERLMQAMESRVAAAKPQRKAVGGPAGQMPAPGDPSASGTPSPFSSAPAAPVISPVALPPWLLKAGKTPKRPAGMPTPPAIPGVPGAESGGRQPNKRGR